MLKKVYVISKARHMYMWRNLTKRLNIISSWIYIEDTPSAEHFKELWPLFVHQASIATHALVYVEPGEKLKDGLIEIGIALAANVKVIVVGNMNELYSFTNHPNVEQTTSIDKAIKLING